MTSKDKLSEYIENLTPEQMEKIVNLIPQLCALLEVSSLPYPPVQAPQIPEVPAC